MNGETIGSYRIIEKLGEGGMGEVYKGFNPQIERQAAIKVLRAELSRQPELLERFRKEAVTLGKLIHPNIAVLYDFLEQGGRSYMVMEFIPGRTLDAILRERRAAMPAEEAVRLVARTLEGIEYAHRMGVLHRDIKPANIMLTPEGQVKITDFGIARVLGSARMTREGRIVGTIEYMAPERIQGRETDVRSDLYSVGVVLYELLSGRLPFESDSEFELMQAQVARRPGSFGELGVAVPKPVEAVVMRALEKDPARRFSSAAEFRTALLAALPEVESSMVSTGGGGSAAAVKMARAASPSSHASAPSRWIAGLTWKHVVGVAALVVIGVLLVGWFALRSQKGTTHVSNTPASLPGAAPAPVVPAGVPPAEQAGEDVLKNATPLTGTIPGLETSAPATVRKRSVAGRTPGASVAGTGSADITSPAAAGGADAEAKRRAALKALGADGGKRDAALKALEK